MNIIYFLSLIFLINKYNYSKEILNIFSKCKTGEIPISGKRAKIVISVKKIRNLFSRSQMTKWISPLESSHEI